MDYKRIAENIIDLKNADLALREKLIQSRQLSKGYNEEMKELHNRNAKILSDIIDKKNIYQFLAKIKDFTYFCIEDYDIVNGNKNVL